MIAGRAIIASNGELDSGADFFEGRQTSLTLPCRREMKKLRSKMQRSFLSGTCIRR
jgi:hypothetical protein